MKTPTIQRGKALVLYGAQGCGKSVLALEIADNAGISRTIESHTLTSPFDLGAALSKKPRTLIIEGAPETDRAWHIVKQLITNDEVPCQRKNQAPVMVRSPDLIFCMQELPDRLQAEPRRFNLVEVRR